jgi:hypothetical protein
MHSSREVQSQIESAVSELVAKLGELQQRLGTDQANDLPRPDELIRMVAEKKDRDPYKAALMSLITDGTIVPSSRWRLSLQLPDATGSR